MIIGKYIRKLLNDRQRVVFPGFGSLEVKEVSGEVSKSGSKINPPGLTVKFDKRYSKDDGILSAALVSGEGMEEEEAKQRVLEMIDAIKFSLDKGESYSLLETGTLWKDDDGKVHFQAVSDWVLEPEQYGLDALDLLELEDFVVEEDDKGNDILLDLPAAQVRKQAAKVSVRSPRRQTEEKSHRHIKRWRTIWMIAGVLIVLLAVLIFIPSKRTKAPVDLVPQSTNQQAENGAAETPVPVPEQAEPETALSVPEKVEQVMNFHIIAGSFKHLKNASDKQDNLKARGYQAEVMITKNRMYRVSAGSYATEGEAERALSAMKSEAGLESCWILPN